MILVDTSAWIEFLRDTGSPVCVRVESLLDEQIATCHPVRMELLAGARDETQLRQLRGLLARTALITTVPGDFDQAAALYRRCRRHGATVGKLTDCLIAAHAIRSGTSMLHAGSDFALIVEHTPLAIEQI